MNALKTICIYCGSKTGNNPLFLETATELGAVIAKSGLDLVYGGARVGLMGAVADAALTHGAKVTGVLPRFLAQEKEVPHAKLTELHIVGSMHERKHKMFELSDAFFILPGGIGTLEEFAEILTWFQLGTHAKPICLLNIAGFYDPLLTLLSHMVESGFSSKASFEALMVASTAEDGLNKILNHKLATPTKKWDLP